MTPCRPSSVPRVLILNHNLVEHGTYFRAIKVAEVLRDRGAEVTFACTGHGRYRARRGRRKGMEFWETPHWSVVHGPDDGWSPLGFMWRMRLVTRRRWDLVWSFSHHPICWLPARLAARESGCPLLVDWCDLYGGEGILGMRRRDRSHAPGLRSRVRDLLDHVEERLELKAAREADLVTVISGFLHGEAVDRAGAEPPHVHPMPSGAELHRIRPRERAQCRRELALDQEAPLLAYIANYHPDERILLDALAIVHRARPDVRLVSCGNGFYGGEAALARHGLERMVTHLGRIPFEQIQTVLGAADVCLTPMTDTIFNQSRWPNKICDYLAAGRAQVACGVGDVAPFFERHLVGVACQPEAEDFARCILRLLDHPRERARMESTARRVAEQELDWDRITIRALEALVAVKPSARSRLGSLFD